VENLTQEHVIDALRKVQDPELHRDIVSLGMVKNLAIDQGLVRFTVELTTPACPLRETIETDCKKTLGEVAGVRGVVSLELVEGRREWVDFDLSGVRVVLDAVAVVAITAVVSLWTLMTA